MSFVGIGVGAGAGVGIGIDIGRTTHERPNTHAGTETTHTRTQLLSSAYIAHERADDFSVSCF